MAMNEAPPAPTAMRQAVLAQAETLVMGSRQKEYGSPYESMNGIATFWNDYVHLRGKDPGYPLDAHDVAIMLALVKVARAARRPADLDSYTDLAGYASIAAEVRHPKDPKHEIAASRLVKPAAPPSI